MLVLKSMTYHCIFPYSETAYIIHVSFKGTAVMQCEWQKVISRWLEYDLKRECGSSI